MIPKLVAKFWKTLDNASAPSGKVDMFHLDDEGGNTVFSLGVSFIDGHDPARAKAAAEEFVKRCNLYPRSAEMVQRFFEAIRSTASQGTYDEAAILKAVGFELAEFIVAAHTDIDIEAYRCAHDSCSFMSVYECDRGGGKKIRLCQQHALARFPGTALGAHHRIGT